MLEKVVASLAHELGGSVPQQMAAEPSAPVGFATRCVWEMQRPGRAFVVTSLREQQQGAALAGTIKLVSAGDQVTDGAVRYASLVRSHPSVGVEVGLAWPAPIFLYPGQRLAAELLGDAAALTRTLTAHGEVMTIEAARAVAGQLGRLWAASVTLPTLAGGNDVEGKFAPGFETAALSLGRDPSIAPGAERVALSLGSYDIFPRPQPLEAIASTEQEGSRLGVELRRGISLTVTATPDPGAPGTVALTSLGVREAPWGT